MIFSHNLPFPLVLFIADVKVTFDDFKKCMIATCDQKTIITANPSEIHSNLSGHLNIYLQKLFKKVIRFTNLLETLCKPFTNPLQTLQKS